MTPLATGLDRVGAITKRPPIWAVVAAVLAGAGGRRGRDAALRGGVAYGIAAFLANVVIKPVVHRRRPQGSEQARVGPLTSSFPSGHAATDLAFLFGVSQRFPGLFLPLSVATFAAHWSLVRTRAHHVSDIMAGGALGIAVAAAVGAVWPDDRSASSDSEVAPAGRGRNALKDNDEERLRTQIDGEDARLLVHIERIDGAAAPTTATPHPARQPEGNQASFDE